MSKTAATITSVTAGGAYAGALDETFRAVRAYIDSVSADATDVHATADYHTVLARFDQSAPRAGTDPVEVIRELQSKCGDGILNSSHPRFYSWVIGGNLPAALGADMLTSVWDQNAAQAACSPAAAAIETVVGNWVKDLLQLPRHCSFALTNGCTAAHITALAAARTHVLREVAGYDLEKDGAFGAPAITVFLGAAAHGTVMKALRLLGFGTRQLVMVPVTVTGAIKTDALLAAVREAPRGPRIVVLQAGEIHTGACDDFATMIPELKALGAWVHIDGAFGLWVRASPKYAPLAHGVELADSWATDGHKWLNSPYDGGFAFVAHPESHFRATGLSASYLATDDCRNQRDWGLELSRRARGFAMWAALRQLGAVGLQEQVERDCQCCAAIAQGVAMHPHAVLCGDPTMNQAVLRFCLVGAAGDRRPDTDDVAADDALTRDVVERVNVRGRCFVGVSVFNGRAVMRVSVCNWGTSMARDVPVTVMAILDCLDVALQSRLPQAT